MDRTLFATMNEWMNALDSVSDRRTRVGLSASRGDVRLDSISHDNDPVISCMSSDTDIGLPLADDIKRWSTADRSVWRHAMASATG